MAIQVMASRVLAPNGGYHRRSAFAALRSHAIPGLDVVDATAWTLSRAVRTPAGPAAVTVSLRDDSVELNCSGPALEFAAAAVRHWLDLDTDVAAVDALLSQDPVLAPLVSARPGLRLFGHPDPFECAIATVLGQQVSTAAARTFTGRVVSAYGEHLDSTTLFPRPQVLAAQTPDELQAAIRVTRARARTVHALAAAVADGDVVLDRTAEPAEFRRTLLAVPGIGPWTSEYLAVRVLADTDAYPAGDLVLRRALGVETAAQATAVAHGWRPYRAYALYHLWAHAAYDRLPSVTGAPAGLAS